MPTRSCFIKAPNVCLVSGSKTCPASITISRYLVALGEMPSRCSSLVIRLRRPSKRPIAAQRATAPVEAFRTATSLACKSSPRTRCITSSSSRHRFCATHVRRQASPLPRRFRGCHLSPPISSTRSYRLHRPKFCKTAKGRSERFERLRRQTRPLPTNCAQQRRRHCPLHFSIAPTYDGCMDSNFLEESLAILTRTPATLDSLLRDLPDAWTSADEGPGTWSPYVVIGHLIHAERSDWIPRLLIILEHGDRRPFDPFDREAQLRQTDKKSALRLAGRIQRFPQ